MITEPGIYTIPAAEYHADPCPEPSLSSSIVKMLCLESAAHAHHAHPRLNPAAVEENGEHFDIGTAAHALLLEGVKRIALIDAKDYRTKVAKDARELAYAAGLTPVLVEKWTALETMLACTRAQLARHTDGGAEMFTNGQAEQTLVWIESSPGEPDVWCRARVDWLRRGAIDDYKTTGASANPETWTRTLFLSGTDIQVAWYLRGVRAIAQRDTTFAVVIGANPTFRFAVQETYPPYALSVIGLGPDALMLAEKKCLYALEKWREARDRNDWQGYPRRTAWASLPMAHEAWWLERECR